MQFHPPPPVPHNVIASPRIAIKEPPSHLPGDKRVNSILRHGFEGGFFKREFLSLFKLMGKFDFAKVISPVWNFHINVGVLRNFSNFSTRGSGLLQVCKSSEVWRQWCVIHLLHHHYSQKVNRQLSIERIEKYQCAWLRIVLIFLFGFKKVPLQSPPVFQAALSQEG